MSFFKTDHTYTSIHDAYLGTLEDIYLNPDYKTSPRGLLIKEKLDYQFKITNPISEPIKTLDPERNITIESYTAKELELYNSGTNQAADFAKASKFWNNIANPDGSINSAYGYLIWFNKSCGNKKFSDCFLTPWEWARMCLMHDKDSRQAILRFSLPEHHYIGVKDFTCTLSANFLIRDDKLNLTVVMRSNDFNKGALFDLPFFISLMDKMILDLKDHHPTLTKGTYTHFVHSIHLYDTDKDKIEKMLGLRG